MENKKQFELNDDALDAVSGGTGGSGTGWNVGDTVEMSSCPFCGKQDVAGVIQSFIYKRGNSETSRVGVTMNCCGRNGAVSLD